MDKTFEPEFGIDSDRDYRGGLNNAARSNSEAPNDSTAVSELVIDAPTELPLHPTLDAAEPNDAGAARAVLQPVEWPAPPLSTDTNAVRELEDFARFVAAMREKDYGDWMRRANVYWEALRDNLLRNLGQTAGPSDLAVIETELGRLKSEIQYRPNWDIAQTQKVVVKKALELRRYFGDDDSIDIHDLEISTSSSDSQRLDENPEPVH